MVQVRNTLDKQGRVASSSFDWDRLVGKVGTVQVRVSDNIESLFLILLFPSFTSKEFIFI
jgi:hypothetical protein